MVMRTPKFLLPAAGALAAALLLAGAGAAVKSPSDTSYLHWPAPGGKYATINGHQIWQLVAEQAQIAERYRDSGHPQFWGRLAGTSSDVEDAQWLMAKFKQIGLETR